MKRFQALKAPMSVLLSAFLVTTMIGQTGYACTAESLKAQLENSQKRQGLTKGGVGNTGGGNTIKATEQDILDFVQGDGKDSKLKDALLTGFITIEHNMRSKKIKDVRILSMMSNFLGKTLETNINWDIFNTQFQVKDQCFDIYGEEREAAVQEFKTGTPICISKSEFMKIPASAMKFEMIALAAHELAHHFGYNEEDATYLQAYFSENLPEMMSLDVLAGKVRSHFLTLESNLKAVAYALNESPSVSDGRLCYNLSAVNTASADLVGALSDILQEEALYSRYKNIRPQIRQAIDEYRSAVVLTFKWTDGCVYGTKVDRSELPIGVPQYLKTIQTLQKRVTDLL